LGWINTCTDNSSKQSRYAWIRNPHLYNSVGWMYSFSK